MQNITVHECVTQSNGITVLLVTANGREAGTIVDRTWFKTTNPRDVKGIFATVTHPNVLDGRSRVVRDADGETVWFPTREAALECIENAGSLVTA